MQPRHVIAAVVAIPAMLGIAAVSEIAMRPSKPAQMQTPAVRVIKSEPAGVKDSLTPAAPSNAVYVPQDADSAAMYQRLHADILSGRRAATKSGIPEREPVEGVDWWVVNGAPNEWQPMVELTPVDDLVLFDEPPVVDLYDQAERDRIVEQFGIHRPIAIAHPIPPGWGRDDRPAPVSEPQPFLLLLSGVVALLAKWHIDKRQGK